ncbi:MAG: FKBP-type peptidyl-prolyl cis-trans isomerase [Pseudomonadota bacterium]|nr:FKBP-type peptidyl-prolyl cis-trans isomerase [Pseudomonadota bacterium]
MSTVTAVPLRPTKRGVIVAIWIAVLAAIAAAFLLAAAAPGDPVSDFLAKNKRQKGVVETPSGLQYQVIAPGSGPHPTDTDVTLVNYEGKLPDGTTFDKSQQPTPLPVTGVVPGFSEALKLMRKGAKYRFWVKPSLGYGGPRPEGAPPMDPQMEKLSKNVLTFDVELLEFLPMETVRRMQMQQQMMQQKQGSASSGAPVTGPGEMPGASPPGMTPGQ